MAAKKKPVWRPRCRRCGKRFTALKDEFGDQECAAVAFEVHGPRSRVQWKNCKLCPTCFESFVKWFGGPEADDMEWIMAGCYPEDKPGSQRQ